MRTLVLIALLAGCGKQGDSATSLCAKAAQHGVDAMLARARERLTTTKLPDDVRARMEERTTKLGALAPRLKAVLTNRCALDKWPADVIACYAHATATDEPRKCRSKLAPEHQAKLQKDELELMANAITDPTTPSDPGSSGSGSSSGSNYSSSGSGSGIPTSSPAP